MHLVVKSGKERKKMRTDSVVTVRAARTKNRIQNGSLRGLFIRKLKRYYSIDLHQTQLFISLSLCTYRYFFVLLIIEKQNIIQLIKLCRAFVRPRLVLSTTNVQCTHIKTLRIGKQTCFNSPMYTENPCFGLYP